MKRFGVLILILLSFSAQVFSSSGKKQIRLRILDKLNAIYDETDIYLDLGTSSNYIYPEDGQKVVDTSSGTPYIYSFSSDGVACFSNSYGSFNHSVIIPIGFRTGGPGVFRFTSTLLDNFDATSIVRLEDRSSGIFYDLRQGGVDFNFSQALTNNARFFLHVSCGTQITTTDAGCNNDNGLLKIIQDTSIVWSVCSLYDDSLNLLSSFTNVSGIFAFSPLPEGDYNLLFGYGVYSVTKPIHLKGHQIIVAASASRYYAAIGENINFSVSSTNTNVSVWDFGDGTIITGITHPDYAYSSAGDYLVKVSCSNVYGCSVIDTFTVYIETTSGIAPISEETIFIHVENKNLKIVSRRAQEYEMELYNLEGQLLQNRTLNYTSSTFDLSNLSGGIYFVKVKTAAGSFSQKVFLR